MKNAAIAFLLGVLVGVGGVWYALESRSARSVSPADERAAQAAQQAQAQVKAAAASVKQAFEAKLEALDLRTEDVREELAETGRVVRRKAREFGRAAAEATVDTRITATIEAKLVKDATLSALEIDVTTADGRVTLAGSVDSEASIGRAMLLAYETEGVREVVSTLQVKAPAAEPES